MISLLFVMTTTTVTFVVIIIIITILMITRPLCWQGSQKITCLANIFSVFVLKIKKIHIFRFHFFICYSTPPIMFLFALKISLYQFNPTL